jgi:hypothetical protein
MEKKNQEAYFVHLDNLLHVNGDSKDYLKCLQKQYVDSLDEFIDYSDYVIHKRLVIKDKYDNLFSFDDLSTYVKQKISQFISIQRYSLNCFLKKLDTQENQIKPTTLKWMATKTDFIEMTNALFEGGFIRGDKTDISKKEFIKTMCNMFGVDCSNWEITLSKAMLRENSAKFTDKLKRTISKYNDTVINI